MYHYNNNLYRSAFNLFDINGDGHIDFQEMNCLLRTLGQRPTEEEVRELCKVSKINFRTFSGCIKIFRLGGIKYNFSYIYPSA